MEEDIPCRKMAEDAEVLRLNMPYNLSPRSSSIFEPLSTPPFEDGHHAANLGTDSYEMSGIEEALQKSHNSGGAQALPHPRHSRYHTSLDNGAQHDPISSAYTPLLTLCRKTLDRPERHPSIVSESSRQTRTGSTGWRFGVRAWASTAAVVFVVNLTLTIWVCRNFPMEAVIVTLISGNCSKIRTWAIWLHLGINVLSTILLTASNYTMQRLLAPTRKEVDKAHVKGQWLAIGVPSIRNLRHQLEACHSSRLAQFHISAFTSVVSTNIAFHRL